MMQDSVHTSIRGHNFSMEYSKKYREASKIKQVMNLTITNIKTVKSKFHTIQSFVHILIERELRTENWEETRDNRAWERERERERETRVRKEESFELAISTEWD